RDGALEQVGGIAFINELTYGLPHFTNLSHYAKIVREHAARRQLIRIGNKISTDALDGEDEPVVVCERAVGMLAAVDNRDSALRRATPLPELHRPALYGLAGDFVRLVEPHTEADPAALLVQFLVAFGNCVGRTPHFAVEADRHYGNLFAVLVGTTASGRKGTSWGHVKRVFESVDEDWARDCVVSGLSSGEGLIWAVRDPIEQCKPVKERGRATGQYENFVADRGVSDKRALVIESEFASVLRAQGREGNTLSAVIRQAWDDGNLRSLTKNSPARATDAHVSVIGHITGEELQRCLGEVERFNGYVNRFLWVFSRRSKFLPEGGSADEEDFAGIVRRLSHAVGFARRSYELRRDEEARDLWRDLYRDLSTRPAGLFGAVTARAAPQVMRLSMLYALLDESNLIQRAHLEAALALWRYSEDSVRYLFGERTGDQLADAALAALREAGERGLTRTELNGVFHGHRKREEIERALSILAESGLASSREEETQGRAVERWFATSYPAGKAEKAGKGSGRADGAGACSAYSAFPAQFDSADGRRGVGE
ncbi:MAG TPA: hypothetical protein VGV38_23810, partial [Pyrinomonadaceae bacterium]|nr:hypothetical protein [Pyrinomonadaceae bacterium]